jgi:L-alanine-DL-glutamate epimerase-like enolase superfamily enzyme
MMGTRSRLTVQCGESVWRYAEPFVIARGVIVDCEAFELALTDERGRTGRSEVLGVTYAGETPWTIRQQIARIEDRIACGLTREELLELLPSGGARCAVDLALWDLEAKQGAGDPFRRNGLQRRPVTTAYTIGIRGRDEYEVAGRTFARCPWLKVKVDEKDPVGAIEALRRGAPAPALIVDPNQAWSVAQLKEIAPTMAALGVRLLEQPTAVGTETELEGFSSPVPLCADESIDDADDLAGLYGKFQVINIKLDKAGGLTAALRLADVAQAQGFELMVGCMGGTSLAMAPGMVLAQRCRYVDLDGSRMLSADRANGFRFVDGVVPEPHLAALWG